MDIPDLLSESLKHMTPLMETVRDPLLVLDSDLRIIKANRSFYTTFKVTPDDTMGQFIYDLGNKQWDIPKLRELLETILPQKTILNDYTVEHDFSTIGKRIMLLNARQVNIEPSKELIILLAIEDITERRRLEDLLINSEKRFRRLFETASDGIVLLEKNEGRVVRANQAVESMLEYSEADSVGKRLEDIGVPIDTRDFSKLMRNLAESGILNYLEVPVKTRSGKDLYTDIYMVDKAVLVQCNIRDVTEQKRTTDALLASQRILEEIINAIPVRVFWKDTNLVFLGCNAAFANDAGLTDPKDIIGKDDYQMVWSDQAELYRSDDLQVIRSGDSRLLIEEPQTTPAGETITLLTSKLPLRNTHGEIIGVIGTYMDITVRKQAEEKFKEQKLQLELTLRASNIGLWDWDLITDNVFFSPEWKKQIGYADEEISNNYFEWEKRVHPDDLEKVKSKIMEFIKHPYPNYENEFRLQHKNGNYRWMLAKASLISDAHGKPIRMLGSHLDITERKQAEAALQKAYFDLDERVKELNCLYGISKLVEKEDSLQNLLQGVVDLIPVSWQYPEVTCAQIKLDGQSYKTDNFKKTEWLQTQEVIAYGKNAGSIEVCYLEEKPEIDERPFLKEERNLINSIAERLGDIIERKRDEEEKVKLESKLQQSYKMDAIGTLAGGIAHDFNNLLSIIVGYAEFIREDSTDNPQMQENIKQVQSAANRATDLVRHILAFSRQSEHELIPVRPQSLVKESIKLLRSTIPTTIEIIQDIDPRCGVVNADPTQINQIVMNLCTNAVHAMDEKGILEVVLQEIDLKPESLPNKSNYSPGKYVCLSVSDTGTGMDRKTIDRIFEPFFTTKDIGKGTGMGLSVVHGIVESHGGFITVESQVGEGSTFNVFLPVTEKEEFFEVEETASIKTGNERILFVDDEPNLVDMGKRILESLSYKVVSESNSTNALEIFKSKPDQFDILITDQSMPDMSGSELIAEVLKIRPDLPCILCTGFSTKVSEENAKELGISKYINKPYNKKVLGKAIREVLDGKV